MKTNDINALEQALPEVFSRTPLETVFDGEILQDGAIKERGQDPVEIAIVEELTDRLDQPESDLSINPVRKPPPLTERLEGIETGSINGDVIDPGLIERITVGGQFPGAPQRYGGGGIPPPDALAFYLPFHRFSVGLYGIYLVAEGLALISQVLHHFGRNYLTVDEAVKLAKAFLFHHEAYHNAVEVFSTRLEIAQRVPVYETGAISWFKSAHHDQHEEAIATGYAIHRATLTLAPPKRPFGRALLSALAMALSPPYSAGAKLNTVARQKTAERRLQEGINRGTPARVKNIHHEVWRAAPHLMHPSLGRGKRFCYLVSRGSPIAKRLPAGGLYFADRRKLVRRLKDYLGGGSEQAGGRHPIFVAPNGTRVPIPTDRDIPEGTLGNILKQLGIHQQPRRFMTNR